jgi:hypothetical protein
MKMKEDKIAWFLSFLNIFLFLIFSLGIILGLRNRLDFSQPIQDRFLDFKFGAKISQRFRANHDFINIVILNFKNPGLENHGQFRFLLLSDKNETLSEQIFSGYNIGDPSQIRFQFEPIRLSKGKDFTIVLESLSSAEAKAVGVGIKNDGNLFFSVYYRASDKKAILGDFVKNIFGRVKNDFLFFIIWFLSITVLLVFGTMKFKIRK